MRNGYYEVIRPPLGAQINILPPYADLVVIYGEKYYVAEGVYYKLVRDYYGGLVYEVVGYD